MNKKLIKLTEGDLHRIIKETTNKILNEIGDTARGQYMLGRLSAAYNEPETNNNHQGIETPIRDYADDIRCKSKYHDKYSKSDETAFNIGRGDYQGSKSIVPDLENKYRTKHGLPKLKESYLHRIVKESVKNILAENDYDDMDYIDDDFNQTSLYGWSIYIYENEYHSDIKFNSEEEAVADCDKKLEELNFYQLTKENDNNEDVVALINVYYENSISDEYDDDDDSDVILANYGFGWYD